MILYAKKHIQVLATLISIILLLLLQGGIIYYQEHFQNASISIPSSVQTVYSTSVPVEEGTLATSLWQLEIPAIDLKAPITEGIDYTNMKTSICHFEESGIQEGNVALAAHNRGSTYNFFERIKELKMGDKMYYTVHGQTKEYEVTMNIIIPETDWSYVQENTQDKLTLITCVEDEPSFRRCVQAISL